MTNFTSKSYPPWHKIIVSPQLPQSITGALAELNEYVVLEEKPGFARAIPIPYDFYFTHEILGKDEVPAESGSEMIEISKLVVRHLLPDAPSAKVGWATAIDMPYYLESNYFFPNEILVVCVKDNNEGAIAAGYARAVPLLR